MIRKHSPAGSLIALSLLLMPTGDAFSQEPIEPTIHWAYASFFGTGWHKINDQRSSFILRVSPRHTFGETGFDENGNREIAYTIQVPFTIGLARLDFDDDSGLLDPGNLTTASLGVIADVDVPLTNRFSIRPSAQLSYGTILDESDNAWTYKAELKGRYAFQSGQLEWALLADLGWAGYEPNRGDPDDIAFASVGAEFAYPVSWFSSQDSQTMLYWHLSFTDFLDEVEVQTGTEEFDSVANFWHVGAAMGKRDKPIRIWFLKFDRLGLGYNFSSTGELRGVKFIFRSLYEL
jgi:hypothetical protein